MPLLSQEALEPTTMYSSWSYLCLVASACLVSAGSSRCTSGPPPAPLSIINRLLLVVRRGTLRLGRELSQVSVLQQPCFLEYPNLAVHATRVLSWLCRQNRHIRPGRTIVVGTQQGLYARVRPLERPVLSLKSTRDDGSVELCELALDPEHLAQVRTLQQVLLLPA